MYCTVHHHLNVSVAVPPLFFAFLVAAAFFAPFFLLFCMISRCLNHICTSSGLSKTLLAVAAITSSSGKPLFSLNTFESTCEGSIALDGMVMNSQACLVLNSDLHKTHHNLHN